MLKCSGSGVNSEKKHLQKTHVCMYSCTCSQCMCARIVVLAANTDLHHTYVQRGGDSHRASKPHMQSGYWPPNTAGRKLIMLNLTSSGKRAQIQMQIQAEIILDPKSSDTITSKNATTAGHRVIILDQTSSGKKRTYNGHYPEKGLASPIVLWRGHLKPNKHPASQRQMTDLWHLVWAALVEILLSNDSSKLFERRISLWSLGCVLF